MKTESELQERILKTLDIWERLSYASLKRLLPDTTIEIELKKEISTLIKAGRIAYVIDDEVGQYWDIAAYEKMYRRTESEMNKQEAHKAIYAAIDKRMKIQREIEILSKILGDKNEQM